MNDSSLLVQFFGWLAQITPFLVARLFAQVLIGFHVVFSFIMLRQVRRMTKVVEARVSPVITSIAVLHLLVSLLAFVWAIILL